MASTVLPNGIIIPEKYSRDWYADLYHNWEELDNLLGGGTPKDGTLTIQKNGTTVGTFSANQATDETIDITVPDVNNGTLTIQKNGTDIGTFSANQATNETVNIEVPDVNNGTLTIQQNGTTVDTFTANSSSDKTVNIQCVDLSSNQTVAGNKEFTGTTTAHDVVPSATNTYNFGSSTNKWKTINGIAPDELGLPTSTYTDVSSYITHFDGTANTFTAPVSGLLFLDGTNSAPSVESVITNNTKVYKMNVAYAFGTLRGLFPVEKGNSISVYINQPITAVARIHHLKGKV